jgi:dipeptidyl aminopeptidase/acylaminoacyl peptidase
MKRTLLAAAVAVLAAGAAVAAPLEVYGRRPAMEGVRISPDGGRIAFVRTVNGKQSVQVDRLSPRAPITDLAVPDALVRALIWADPNHLLVLKVEPNGSSSLQSIDLEKRRPSAVLSRYPVIAGLPEARTVGGHGVVFVQSYVTTRSQAAAALIAADLVSGDERIVDSTFNTSLQRSWSVDAQGGLLAQSTYDEDRHVWTLRLRRGGSWAEAYSNRALTDTPALEGVSPDGASLVLKLTRDDGAPESRPVSLADGKLGEPLAQYDAFQALYLDPMTRRIVGGRRTGLKADYGFFDPKDQADWDEVVRGFPGEEVELLDWSNDRRKLLIRVTGPKHGAAFEVADLSSHQTTDVGREYGGVGPDDVAEVRAAAYPAADGLPINAFVTLPRGREPKDLPLVVLAHGGLGERDPGGFDWFAQALASRGYAVLQPQYRGSSGLGWTLESAGYGQVGRKMQTDLSDGVRALAARGWVDPGRVCIVGENYGGYAALAGVTMERGVYRCAISVDGISDLHRLVDGGLVDPQRNMSARILDRWVGARDTSDRVYDQLSPLRHAAEARAPILLIQERGGEIPRDQSDRMADALRAAHKQVETLTLGGDAFGLSNEGTRLQMLQATVAFLGKNNPPQ